MFNKNDYEENPIFKFEYEKAINNLMNEIADIKNQLAESYSRAGIGMPQSLRGEIEKEENKWKNHYCSFTD